MNKEFLSNIAIKNTLSMFAKFSEPFVIFDQNRNLLFANNLFYKDFANCLHLPKKIHQHPRKLPINSLDMFYLKTDDTIIRFSKISIETIINLHHHLLFSSINGNKEENYYRFIINKITTINNLDIFFMIIINETPIKMEEQQKSVRALIKASKLKDNDTGQHVERVNKYSELLASHLARSNNKRFQEINSLFIKKISNLAALHDVGKIGTPDKILTKPGTLTNEEFNVMKEHCINGALILYSVTDPMGRDIALSHHEKWDGSGYPYQLAGESISLAARIVAIADVYDALRMERPYKESFSHIKSMNIILKENRSHFQPELISVFEKINKQFEQIYLQMSSEQSTNIELLKPIN